jgi:16S rRNA (cytosine967-C5)-methyltransferase
MSVREGEWAALMVVERVVGQGAYLNLALGEVLDEQRLLGASRAMATALARTTLENLIAIDFALDTLTDTKRCGRVVKNILRLSAARVLFMQTEDAVATSAAVELARRANKKAQAGYVNGVMRALAAKKAAIPWPKREEDAATYLGIRYSYPRFATAQAIRQLGEDGAERMLASPPPPYTTVRVNLQKTTVDDVAAKLRAAGGQASPSPHDAAMLRVSGVEDLTRQAAYEQGLLSIQGEASMIASRQIPADAAKVMDLCAAPGGKSFAMAERMPNARILAFDLHPHRVKLMQAQRRRLGLENVECAAADAAVMIDAHRQSADAVLVDAPCSGLGTARKRPDVKFNRDFHDVLALARLQADILNTASGYVKAGGILVYCTCTFLRQENRDIVENFLRAHAAFSLVPLALPPSMGTIGEGGMAQLWPHQHGTDGFFIAKMQRLHGGEGD